MMNICSRSGSALLAAFLLGRVGAWGAERREFFNRSGRDWRITLVEGTRAGVGNLQVIDKFSGNKIATLTKVGDSIAFPAGARYLVEFTCENRYFFHDFIVQDSRGYYVEYLASVPFLSDPTPVLSFKDKHLGPPLDQATDEAALRTIEGSISTDQGNLVILRDFICPELPPPPVM